MLIELKDPSSKDNELLDSILSIVERANKLSLYKNQLQKDYVAFAEPDKPLSAQYGDCEATCHPSTICRLH